MDMGTSKQKNQEHDRLHHCQSPLDELYLRQQIISFCSCRIRSSAAYVHLALETENESKRKVSNRKHDINKLLIPDVRAAYQEELKRFRDKPINSMTLDQEAERYSQIIKETADTVLGFQLSRKKPWISDATLEFTDFYLVPGRTSINAFTRQIRSSIAMDNEQWCNTNCDQ